MTRIHKSLSLVWAIVPALLACQTNSPAPAPTVPPLAHVKSFSASPTQLNPGESTTLSWEVENATSVSIQTIEGVAVSLADPSLQSGNVVVPVEHNSIFVLNAAGEGGSDTAVTSVVVIEKDTAPSVFSAVPASIRAGEKTTLVWNAPNATLVELHDSNGQLVPTAGMKAGTVSLAPRFTTSYTLNADGIEQSVTVTVGPGLLAFQSDVPEASPGATVNLSWQVGSADSVILSSADRGVLTTVTDKAQIADGSFADTLPTTLPSNGLMEYTLEARTGGTAIFSSLTVYVAAKPVIVSFECPSFVKPGVDFPVSWQTALADRVEVVVGGKVIYLAPTRDLASAGTVFVPGIQSPTTVELRTSDFRGGSKSKSVQVSPVGPPTFTSFTASPSPLVNGGDQLTLSWVVPNARHVKISRLGGRVLAELDGATLDTGSVVDYPNKQTVYTLEASNGAGEVIVPQQLTVNVTNPARLLFSPNDVPSGAQVQLTGASVTGDLYTVEQVFRNQPGTQFVDIAGTGQPLPVAVGDKMVWYPVELKDAFQARWPTGYLVGGKKLYVSPTGNVVFSDTPVVGFLKLPPGAVRVASSDLRVDTQSRIYWQMDGTGSQRRLIIQWNNMAVEEYPFPPVHVPLQIIDHATMQVQFYATGEVVMAFQKGMENIGLRGSYPTMLSINVPGSGIGVPGNNPELVYPLNTAFPSGTSFPQNGDTLRFFGKFPVPYPMTATTAKLNAEVQLANGERLTIQDGATVIPPGSFNINEINYKPAAGQPQWIELQNNTAQPVELEGWYLDLGSVTTRHAFSKANGTTLIPPNGGRLLLAATNSPVDGAVVDYAYGTSFVIPTTSGTLRLGRAEGTLDTISWTSAGAQGVSIQKELPPAGMLLGSGVTALSCPSYRPYGSNGQMGTPGAANSRCLRWTVAPATPSFESIAATGTPITGLVSTGDNTPTTFNAGVNFTATAGGRAVKIGNTVYGSATSLLRVDANGYIALSGTNSSDFNGTLPSTGNPNGTLAIFWADLAANATTNGPSGVYWQQFNPDGILGNADDYTLVSWENWKRYSPAGPTTVTSSLNFQIKILEATGDVEFQYGNMTSLNGIYSNGADATVWMESMDGNGALPISVKQPNIGSNTGYHFSFVP